MTRAARAETYVRTYTSCHVTLRNVAVTSRRNVASSAADTHSYIIVIIIIIILRGSDPSISDEFPSSEFL